MLSFATEFPVKRLNNKAAYVSQIIAWLKGTNYSNIFDNPETTDLDSDTVNLKSNNGETITIRELEKNNEIIAIGFRYDYEDKEGRLWRTESVIKRSDIEEIDIARFRTQCIAKSPEAIIETPRKPYLIKNILQDEWGTLDGLIETSEAPILLSDDAKGLDIAEAITKGTASRFLPIIYVSALAPRKWTLSEDQIRKLAFDLGGVAHVVLEPSRKFSFKLRDRAQGKNSYGGALGFCLPQRGITKRIFGKQNQTQDLLKELLISSIDIRSQMPAEGWDWSELQEQAFRHQRQRDRNRLSFDEKEALYEDEIESLKERIQQLEQDSKERLSEKIDTLSDSNPLSKFLEKTKEIYSGELFDRIRYAAKKAESSADQLGLDTRTIALMKELVETSQYSPELTELREDLKRASRDRARFSTEMANLLERHGYNHKSDNKHARLEPREGYFGLDNITLAKTPGEGRGLENARKQIERTLGIAHI